MTKILFPCKERLLSPEEYLADLQTQRNNIESVSFIPPKTGQNDYGFFIVRYKNSVLVEEK